MLVINTKLVKWSLPIAAMLISACTLSDNQRPEPDPDTTYKLTILHTNDHHGRFWHDSKGQYGMAARKTLVDQIRAEVENDGGELLLLSGGDINTGVPESDLQNAIPDFKGMNLLGYDAMAVGNHEFDKSQEVLAQQEEIANFPFLSANIFKKADGELLFEPYTFFDKGDLRIAVLGLTTDDTPKATSAKNVEGLEFASPVEAASKWVPQLNEQADIVIAVTHMGHYQNANHGVNAPGDVTLARKVSGIDLIVGGHSQTPLFKPDFQNNTWIVQAHEWGKYVGRADFEYKAGVLKMVDYKLIPVNHKDSAIRLAPNPEMVALLQPFQEQGQALVGGTIGSIDAPLLGDRSDVRFRPTNMGTLIGRALMEKADADLAVMNGGGIRDGIDAGEITYKEALTVFPFGNTLVSIAMTGQEILDYLNVVAPMPTNSGAFAHFAGVEMVIENGKVHDVKIGGTAIDVAKTYKLAMLSFSASGGDGYPDVSKHAGFVDHGFADADVLKSFIENHSPLKAADFEPTGVERR